MVSILYWGKREEEGVRVREDIGRKVEKMCVRPDVRAIGVLPINPRYGVNFSSTAIYRRTNWLCLVLPQYLLTFSTDFKEGVGGESIEQLCDNKQRWFWSHTSTRAPLCLWRERGTEKGEGKGPLPNEKYDMVVVMVRT